MSGNSRSYLERQLDAAGIARQKRESQQRFDEDPFSAELNMLSLHAPRSGGQKQGTGLKLPADQQDDKPRAPIPLDFGDFVPVQRRDKYIEAEVELAHGGKRMIGGVSVRPNGSSDTGSGQSGTSWQPGGERSLLDSLLLQQESTPNLLDEAALDHANDRTRHIQQDFMNYYLKHA